MRRAAALGLAVVLLVALPAAVRAADADLYVGRTIVTGEGEASRAAGIVRCLEEVLVKLAGDPRLAEDPRVAALSVRSAGLVAAVDYRDRMAGIPVHDEQGTRDRPFDLTVTFDAAAIDDVLAGLGRRPWTDRPPLLLLVAVETEGASFILDADGMRGRDMREAVRAAAERFGLELRLPSRADLAALHSPAHPSEDAVLAALAGDAVAVSGRLRWDEAGLGWRADWRLARDGSERHWSITGVSFDVAFRSAAGGAALILSGSEGMR